ncbi:NepR family anti-sigma factor [Citromicrobium bathyomarinum]|uniref:NepR family anti-sigma factor n=1 Tax=Citromicrobium bathyomarinum TaxID=72174 RepID=UPI00315B2020
MDEKDNQKADAAPKQGARADKNDVDSPQWTDSLRSMYDSVVDEPIPDSFKDLLAQLDDKPQAQGSDKGKDTA